MTAFDEKIIIKMVDRLYRRARIITVTYGFAGLLLGTVAGFLAAESMVDGDDPTGACIIVGASLVGLALGVALASEKAFQLRLQAQQLMCQVQIERNTRPRAHGELGGEDQPAPLPKSKR